MTAELKKLLPELNENQHKLLDEYIKKVLGSYQRGCDLHHLPSAFCSSGYCMTASVVNSRLNQQRKRAGL